MLERVCSSACRGPHIREEIERLLAEVAAGVERGCMVVTLVRPQTTNLPCRAGGGRGEVKILFRKTKEVRPEYLRLKR